MSLFNLFGHRRMRPAKAVLRVEMLEDRDVPSCTVIAGHVFDDANNNGLFDAGERPLASVLLQLKNDANVIVDTATTDANGHYLFDTDQTAVAAPTTETKTVTFGTTKTDWTQTQGVDQFDPSLGTLTGVEIINDASLASQIKFESLDGAQATVTGTVAGTVTLTGAGASSLVTDTSADETFQAGAFDGTPDFAGASGHDFGSKSANASKSITLTNPSDLAAFTGTGQVSLTETAHATSSATGAGNLLTQINSTASAQVRVIYHYTPTKCLQAGNYTIVEATQPPGYMDGKESQNGVVLASTLGTDTIHVDVIPSVTPLTTPDQPTFQSLTNDFAKVKPASVSGFVYVDPNNNGIMEAGEPPIPGTTITLTGSDDTGANVGTTAQTAVDGSYFFGNLRPGQYWLTETQPAGFLDGKTTVGSLGGFAVPNQMSLTINPGNAGINYNFGELPVPVTGIGNPDPPPVQPPPVPPPPTQPPAINKRMFLASSFRA
jgi:hypothetical protein